MNPAITFACASPLMLSSIPSFASTNLAGGFLMLFLFLVFVGVFLALGKLSDREQSNENANADALRIVQSRLDRVESRQTYLVDRQAEIDDEISDAATAIETLSNQGRQIQELLNDVRVLFGARSTLEEQQAAQARSTAEIIKAVDRNTEGMLVQKSTLDHLQRVMTKIVDGQRTSEQLRALIRMELAALNATKKNGWLSFWRKFRED